MVALNLPLVGTIATWEKKAWELLAGAVGEVWCAVLKEKIDIELLYPLIEISMALIYFLMGVITGVVLVAIILWIVMKKIESKFDSKGGAK